MKSDAEPGRTKIKIDESAWRIYRRLLGYAPATSLEEGLRAEIAWFESRPT